ncbi:MAG: DUF4091 domain-containing protein [Clostridia bacterium]|nr:DUF4091 domain-containing protein [Clostridia bacterium]
MKLKTVSSLEKVFIDSKITDYAETSRLSALRGERVSFQVAFTTGEGVERCEMCAVSLSGDLAPLSRVRKVKNVPVEYPVYPDRTDDNYLRKTAGLYPDLLLPMTYVDSGAPYGKVRAATGALRSLWIDLTIPDDLPAGEHTITVALTNGDGETDSVDFTIDVIGATLPKQELICTEWFHTDCLANYYGVPVWSDEHFRVIRNFVKVARANGINMLLVPVFTPPLDTAVGGERLTTQLVKVKKVGDSYVFGFDTLDRYLDLIKEEGIEYYEISHLYTQWGVYHAPKIVADVDGKEEKIFGWETDSHSEEYVGFLRAFLTAFIAHMKARGEDEKCYFHISDEPSEDHLESYMSAKRAIADLLDGYHVMDALSNFDFYSRGVVKDPIPASDHIEPFLEANIPDLWTYYCCGQCVGVSNRLVAMPSWRNRAMGMQMYRYGIKGFLQWGYNFYNNRFSADEIEPYSDLSGEFWVPAGDTFSVYPAKDGTALESLRLVVFNEGLTDMRAMKLCESLYGKDEAVRAVEKAYGKKITFDDCPRSAYEMLRVREAVNAMIKAKCK